MSKKYVKTEDGVSRAITTPIVQLEKPLVSDYYDINVHNRNMDLLDAEVNRLRNSISGIQLRADKVSIEDRYNLYTATNVEDALKEVKQKVDGMGGGTLVVTAETVTVADRAGNFNSDNVEGALAENSVAISTNRSNIRNLEIEVNGQRSRGITIANALIDKVEGR